MIEIIKHAKCGLLSASMVYVIYTINCSTSTEYKVKDKMLAIAHQNCPNIN